MKITIHEINTYRNIGDKIEKLAKAYYDKGYKVTTYVSELKKILLTIIIFSEDSNYL